MNKKITISSIAAIVAITAVLAVSLPVDVLADYKEYSYPEISGSIAVGDSDYQGLEQITLSDAMRIAQGQVTDSNAMWGDLKVIQGYLVYKVGLLSDDDKFYKVLVDAGNGDVLYVSDAKTKDSWANHSKDGKWKDHYADLTPEQRELKMKQWGEVKDAFFALDIDERAKLVMHFMSMKSQWDGLSDEQRDAKKAETKEFMNELLPLSVEEKTERLRQYINSI